KRWRGSLWSSASLLRSPAGSRPAANESVMQGSKSHSLFSTASFKDTRPTPISITAAIASSAFSLASSSPDLCSNISGPSALESNREPQNEVVEENLRFVVDLRIVRLRPSRNRENNGAAHSNDRRKGGRTHTGKTTLGRSGASTTVGRARRRSLGGKDFSQCLGATA